MKKQIVLLSIALALLLAGCNNPANRYRLAGNRQTNKPWTRWWWMGNDIDSANLT